MIFSLVCLLLLLASKMTSDDPSITLNKCTAYSLPASSFELFWAKMSSSDSPISEKSSALGSDPSICCSGIGLLTGSDLSRLLLFFRDIPSGGDCLFEAESGCFLDCKACGGNSLSSDLKFFNLISIQKM